MGDLCRKIALHRCQGGPLLQSGPGASARDLMQPIFALVAAETACRWGIACLQLAFRPFCGMRFDIASVIPPADGRGGEGAVLTGGGAGG